MNEPVAAATVFQVAEQPSLRRYLYTPADERTEAKLRDAGRRDQRRRPDRRQLVRPLDRDRPEP